MVFSLYYVVILAYHWYFYASLMDFTPKKYKRFQWQTGQKRSRLCFCLLLFYNDTQTSNKYVRTSMIIKLPLNVLTWSGSAIWWLFASFSLATQATQSSRLRSAYCYCSTVCPAALLALCSEAERSKQSPNGRPWTWYLFFSRVMGSSLGRASPWA